MSFIFVFRVGRQNQKWLDSTFNDCCVHNMPMSGFTFPIFGGKFSPTLLQLATSSIVFPLNVTLIGKSALFLMYVDAHCESDSSGLLPSGLTEWDVSA